MNKADISLVTGLPALVSSAKAQVSGVYPLGYQLWGRAQIWVFVFGNSSVFIPVIN